MSSRVNLNEAQLLLLQQEMQGDVSGLGYRLEVVGVDTADFTGGRDEDLHRTSIVREADESGQIRKIKFYIDYSGQQNEPSQAVMLRVFDDGHVTCTKPVHPNLLDLIVDSISDIKEYEEFLVPLNGLMERYIDDKFRGRSSRRKYSHARDTNEAFRELVEHHFDPDRVSGAQHRLYQSLIANVGVAICEGGVPPVGEFDEVTEADGVSDSDGKIQEFFEDYSRRVLNQDDVDFDVLRSHLTFILQKDWDSPLDVIEDCIEMYDLG
jgi:hypothetical protein